MTLNRIGVIAAMARQNIKGAELAERAGVGVPAVVKARNGKPIRESTAQKIATALGVDLNDLKEVAQ